MEELLNKGQESPFCIWGLVLRQANKNNGCTGAEDRKEVLNLLNRCLLRGYWRNSSPSMDPQNIQAIEAQPDYL